MTADVDIRKKNEKKKSHSGFMDAWRGMLDVGDSPNIIDPFKRRKTKASYNIKHKNMRRKMAKRSRRINRHKKGKRKRKI